MTIDWQKQLSPGVALREIVSEATAALILMDAERLEELAKCCVDLNRETEETGQRHSIVEVRKHVEGELKLLGQVLFETRANLTVLSRLHTLRLSEVDRQHASRQRSSRWRSAYGNSTAGVFELPQKAAEYGDD